MRPTEFACLAIASYFHIGLRAVQQLNVTHDRKVWVPVTCLFLALFEVYVVASVAAKGVGWPVLAVALGATGGTLSAMVLHRRMR